MRYGADTWFLLSLWDADAHSATLIQNVRNGKDQLCIPVPAFSETIKKLMQRGIKEEKIETFWTDLAASEKIRIVPLDRVTAKEAARISITYGVPLVDAFIAATAKLSGCDALLSADADMATLARKKYLAVKSW